MKILYITNGINGSGGLERVLSTKVSAMTDVFGHDVTILTLNEFPIKPFFTFSEKIKLRSINVAGNPIKYISSYFSLVKMTVREIDPALIIVCDDGLKAFFLPKYLGKKIPIIYERHVSKLIEKRENASPIKTIITKLKWRLMDYLGTNFNAFVVLTNSTKNEWKTIRNIKVIPNPLSFYPQEVSTLDHKNVIAVGKLTYQKGYDLLLEAWQIVVQTFPDWKLNIYGKKDQVESLSQQAKQLNIVDNVTFHDPVKDIESKYLNSSIYVMSSRYEGFGMVLVEAMACGVPCVSFDCNYGPSEIIENGADGYVVENGNVKELAQKMKLLMADESLRKTFGQKARQNVRRFEIGKIMASWNDLFEQMIKNV